MKKINKKARSRNNKKGWEKRIKKKAKIAKNSLKVRLIKELENAKKSIHKIRSIYI